MNLLFVIDNLGSGGAQRQLVLLSRGLKSRGYLVEFFVYYPDDHYRELLDAESITIHEHVKSFRLSIGPIISLRRLIVSRPFDAVLSFLDTPNFYAEMALMRCRKTKLIVSERYMYPQGTLPLGVRLLQSCHRRADAITVNSHHQRQKMIRAFPWMSTKLTTIYNGVDLEKFKPDLDRANRSNRALTLVAIGSIVAKKNMLNLGKALAICRDHYRIKPIVRWVGKRDYTESGKRDFKEIAEYLVQNDLNEQWEWLGERMDIPDLLRIHDSLIHPSFSEGLPNSICEALACGLPVLASNVCDHPRLVENRVRGLLFDPYSPASIASAIHEFSILGPEARDSMSKAARSYAESCLSASAFVGNYERLFKSVVLNYE